ncbi:hypothetical protein EZS27_042833, partial [termite gut metagenome]
MRPNFKDLDIFAAFQSASDKDGQKANNITANWKTPEHIDV